MNLRRHLRASPRSAHGQSSADCVEKVGFRPNDLNFMAAEGCVEKSRDRMCALTHLPCAALVRGLCCLLPRHYSRADH
jgi:hypothetical protein